MNLIDRVIIIIGVCIICEIEIGAYQECCFI